MIRTKKDRKEQKYKATRRKANQIRNLAHQGKMSVEEAQNEIDDLYETNGIDEKNHYVEFCKYLRAIGRSNWRQQFKSRRSRKLALGFRRALRVLKERSTKRSDRGNEE